MLSIHESWSTCNKIVTRRNENMDFPILEALKLLEHHRCLIEHWGTTFLTTSFDRITEHVTPFINNPHLLDEFYSMCKRCQYNRDISHHVTPITLKSSNDGMSPKKKHEVTHLVPYLKHLAEENDIHTIVDVGAGRCYCPCIYLRTFPTDDSIRFVCLEDALSLCEGNWAPEKILDTIPSSQRDRIRIETTRIDKDSALNIPVPYLMYSLHSCGELSNHMLRMFVQDQQSRVICIIGCCHHLLDGFLTLEHKEHWSRDHFSLANINGDSITEACLERLYRRALLETLSPGMMQESYDMDFVQYCKIHHINKTAGEVQQVYERYVHTRSTLNLAWKMRCCLGAVMESVIVYDRVAYLKSNGIEDVNVVAMWDGHLSPRNLAIIAKKDHGR